MSGSRLQSCLAPWSRPLRRSLPSDPRIRLCGRVCYCSINVFCSLILLLLTQDGPTSVVRRFYFETIMVAMFTIEFIARFICHSDSLKQLKKFLFCKYPQCLFWRVTFRTRKERVLPMSLSHPLQHLLPLSTFCRFCHTTSRWPWQKTPPYTFASLFSDCSDFCVSSGLSNTRRRLSWRSRSWLWPSNEAWTPSVHCSSSWSRERCSFRPFCISRSEVKRPAVAMCVLLVWSIR